MDKKPVSGIVGALLLILAGIVALAVQLVPGWQVWISGERGWPLTIVVAGLLLLVAGLATRTPGMAVPACIAGGIGGILYWQNATGDWASWAYVWALIPGFAGVGVILCGLIQRRGKQVVDGAWTVLVSLLLYTALASFLGGVSVLGPYWPVLIIILGLALLVRRIAFAR